MLDTICDDALLLIINNLNIFDICRLSQTNKHLLNIIDKYNVNNNVTDVVDVNNYKMINIDQCRPYKNILTQHKIHHNEFLLKLVNKFPNIKIKIDNFYIPPKDCYKNIYKYNFSCYRNHTLLKNEAPIDERLTEIINNCHNIKIMSITGSHIIDISPLKNLDKLYLGHCNNISDISMLGNIKDLTMSNCPRINNLPEKFYSTNLKINYCNGIINNNILVKLVNVETLSLCYDYNIDNLNFLFCNKKLKKLRITNQSDEVTLFHNIDNLEELEIYDCSENLTVGNNIKSLKIEIWDKLKTIPKIDNLEKLRIVDNTMCGRGVLDFDFSYLHNLTYLCIEDIGYIGDSIKIPQLNKLKTLILEKCQGDNDISSLSNLTHLDELTIINSKFDFEYLKDFVSIDKLKIVYNYNFNTEVINDNYIKSLDFSYLNNIETKSKIIELN